MVQQVFLMVHAYSGGEIIINNSGYNLSFTSETKPTDQIVVKSGYKTLQASSIIKIL